MSDKFLYVTYIRTSPEKLWDALTKPEFTRAYWFGVTHDCDWHVGSPWRMSYADGRVTDAGEVVEIDRPRRLVLKWRNEWKPELKAEGYSRATFEQARDRPRWLETHRSCVGRLAEDSLEPEKPARNRHCAGAAEELTGHHCIRKTSKRHVIASAAKQSSASAAWIASSLCSAQ
jgi:uncharacterized protein YndB with AHSA1/START domain